jgi:aspartate/methionine/tyrosine aminotransferase
VRRRLNRSVKRRSHHKEGDVFFAVFEFGQDAGVVNERPACIWQRQRLSARVAVIPGSAFGGGGERHIRIAYCKSYGQCEIALERIRKFVSQI